MPIFAIKDRATAEAIAKYAQTSVENLTFSDIFKAAGVKWSDLGLDGRGVFRPSMTLCTASGSCNIGVMSYLYEVALDVTGVWGIIDEDAFNAPEFQSALEIINNKRKVDKSYKSTSKLTDTLATHPFNKVRVALVYESKIPALREKLGNDVVIVRSPTSVAASHPVLITAKDDRTKAAAQKFVRYLISAASQNVAMEKGFRPVSTEVKPDGFVKELLSQNLGVIDEIDPDVVRAVLPDIK